MAPYVAGSVECFLVHRRPGSQAEFELVCKPQSGLRTGLSLIALEVVGSIPSRAIIALSDDHHRLWPGGGWRGLLEKVSVKTATT